MVGDEGVGLRLVGNGGGVEAESRGAFLHKVGQQGQEKANLHIEVGGATHQLLSECLRAHVGEKLLGNLQELLIGKQRRKGFGQFFRLEGADIVKVVEGHNGDDF